MNDGRVMYPCFCCGRQVQFGPHRYDGRAAQLYGNVPVCMTCWSANWDGWSPTVEPKLLALLAERGLPVPARNENGLLPRGD